MRGLAMFKSDWIERISSQNPHLYHRDVEKIVDAIFDQIIEALCAEIEWSYGVSACFRVSSAKRGLGAILVLELPFRSHRRPCLSSRLEKKCESDLTRKLRCRLIEQRESFEEFLTKFAQTYPANAHA